MTNATMLTNHGSIELELFDDAAPKTVQNFIKLAQDGFYDGVIFHRVIQDFMIQGGDPTGTGSGGPGYQFEDEFNDHKVVRGALAMANAGPNTNGSQFFIVTTGAAPWLDGKHTVFGQVTSGMDVVDAIEGVDTGPATSRVRTCGSSRSRSAEDAQVAWTAMSQEPADDTTASEIACPHCKKTFTADLMAGAAERYRGFKCPHCKLFVPAARIKA